MLRTHLQSLYNLNLLIKNTGFAPLNNLRENSFELFFKF